jgi:hypothetical protein
MLPAGKEGSMGFLLRSSLVIGTIFVISPVRDGGVPDAKEVRSLANAGAGKAAQAALSLCGDDRAACIARAADHASRLAQSISTTATPESTTKRPELPVPAPRPQRLPSPR